MDTLEITRLHDPDGRTVLAVRGEVDATTATLLQAAVLDELVQARHLVLDVSAAMRIDPPGLRALTAAQHEATALGRPPIVLRGVRPLLAKTLQLSGLADLFPREPAPALTRRPPAARAGTHPGRSRRRERTLEASPA